MYLLNVILLACGLEGTEINNSLPPTFGSEYEITGVINSK
mgnify:CR=1 FL=1